MMKENKTVYVAGKALTPLNGDKEKFINACTYYEERGFDVINPYDLKDLFFPASRESICEKEQCGLDFYFLSKADILVVMDDWQKSSIAPYELALATKFKIPVIRAFSFERMYMDYELKVEEIDFHSLFDTLDEEPGLEKCKVKVLCD